MGDWYTIGLCLGLGLGLSMAITGILGTNVLGIGAAAVVGAVRRGATRFGVGAYMGALGVLVCLVALIPVAGYALAVALPVLAARLRGRQAARFAGLRTLAK